MRAGTIALLRAGIKNFHRSVSKERFS
jgi:hypothetical protein